MFVLDTNHLWEFSTGTQLGRRLRDRVQKAGELVVISIISAEEGLRGWLAKIASVPHVGQQVLGYDQLNRLLTTLNHFVRLPWDAEAAARFRDFREQGIRISTMDLKIACITLEHDATILTRNTSDFAKVPGLKYENWLD